MSKTTRYMADDEIDGDGFAFVLPSEDDDEDPIEWDAVWGNTGNDVEDDSDELPIEAMFETVMAEDLPVATENNDDGIVLIPEVVGDLPVVVIPMDKIEARRISWDTNDMTNRFTDGWRQMNPITLLDEGPDNLYYIVDGVHRMDAMRRAGRETIEARILPEGISRDQATVYTLMLNSMRDDNPVTQLFAILDLYRSGLRARAIAKMSGIPENTVKQRLRLRNLHSSLLDTLKTCKVPHLAAKFAVELSENGQIALATLIMNRVNEMSAMQLNNPRCWAIKTDEVKLLVAAEEPTMANTSPVPLEQALRRLPEQILPTVIPNIIPDFPAEMTRIEAANPVSYSLPTVEQLAKEFLYENSEPSVEAEEYDPELQTQINECLAQKPWEEWALDCLTQLRIWVPRSLRSENILIDQLEACIEPRRELVAA